MASFISPRKKKNKKGNKKMRVKESETAARFVFTDQDLAAMLKFAAAKEVRTRILPISYLYRKEVR